MRRWNRRNKTHFFDLLDDAGQRRAALGVGTKGESPLCFYNMTSTTRAQIGNGGILLDDESGKNRVLIGDSGEIFLTDASGKPVRRAS